MAENNGRHWTEHFKILTPILLICVNLLAGTIITNQNHILAYVEKIDNKLFSHLTNEEIHTPRGLVVSQGTFAVYQTMRDKEIGEIKDRLYEIRDFLKGKR